MIQSDEALAITIEQLARLARVLASACAEELPVSRQWFAIMSEGPRDHIQRLLDEVNEYMATWPKVEDESEADATETHAA